MDSSDAVSKLRLANILLRVLVNAGGSEHDFSNLSELGLRHVAENILLQSDMDNGIFIVKKPSLIWRIALERASFGVVHNIFSSKLAQFQFEKSVCAITEETEMRIFPISGEISTNQVISLIPQGYVPADLALLLALKTDYSERVSGKRIVGLGSVIEVSGRKHSPMLWSLSGVPELGAPWHENYWKAGTYFAVTKQPAS